MAQFDSLIIFPLIWSLLYLLTHYYYLLIKISIPSFFETKKFRQKKLSIIDFYKFLQIMNIAKSNYSYNNVR
jgi:hypothetical protein